MARGKGAKHSEVEFASSDDLDDYNDSSPGSRVRGRQLYYDLLGRWHWIALGLILGILASLYYLSKAPKAYQATSTLLVKQRAATVISEAGGQEDDIDLRSAEAVNTVAQQVKRVELLTRLAQDPEILTQEGLVPEKVNWFPEWSRQWLGEETPSAPKNLEPTALGQIIGSWTSVSVRKNTRLLDITVEHPNPEIASLIANTIAREYELELGGKRVDGRTTESKVLNKELKLAQELLQEKEGALANYQIALDALEELKKKEEIFSELDLRYLSGHPKWIAAKATLDEFRKRFLSEFVSVREATADHQYWEDKRSEWDRKDLNENEVIQIARRLLTARVTVLAGEIKNQKTVYDNLMTQKLETDVDIDSLEAEVELSELSQTPTLPTSPKKMTALAGGSILGMGVGLAFAFLLVKLDNKINTVLQAEQLTDLPVLATIRRIDPKILDEIVARKNESSASRPPADRNWDPRIVFRPELSETVYTEMFRILRASITLLGNETKRNVTLFSSALPGEGKTLISTNFAIASAQQGKKTLLLDLDLRKPADHKVFGLKRKDLQAGVTEILAGQAPWQDAVSTATFYENLSCIFAGTKAPNPGELLNPDVVAELLEPLAQEFDVIVIDSAPLLAVPDTRLLIPIVDNFCLVVRAEHTPKSAVEKVLALLEEDGSEPAGIVFNCYEEKAGLLTRKYRYGYGQYGKGYGDGSYGSYGSDEGDD